MSQINIFQKGIINSQDYQLAHFQPPGHYYALDLNLVLVNKVQLFLF